jgi:hypothetical protein
MLATLPDRTPGIITRCQGGFCTVRAPRSLSDLHIVFRDSMSGQWLHGIKVGCPYHAHGLLSPYQSDTLRFIWALIKIGGAA